MPPRISGLLVLTRSENSTAQHAGPNFQATKLDQVMNFRNPLMNLIAESGARGLIAAGLGMHASAAELVPAGIQREGSDASPPGHPPRLETSPVEDFAPRDEAVSGQEAPPPDGKNAPPEDKPAEPAPQAAGAAASEIPPPDGVDPAELIPIIDPPEDLGTATATPFSLPVAGSTEESEGTEGNEPAGEVPAPDDDRSAPWVAAPGGFSAAVPGGVGSGLSFAPSGFTSANPGFPMGGVATRDGLFEGFSIAASFSGTYNSNATSSPGEPFAPIQDDFILGLGGSISYLSTAAEWTFGGSYSGTYNQYLELSDFSGYDQTLSLLGNYDGGRLSASVNGSIGYTQGNNRYYSSEFVQQTSYYLGANLRYRLSTKTSLQGTISQSFSTTSENSFNDTESFSLGLAGLWRYSKLTEFGPGVRYSFLSGGNRDSRTSIGPELLVNYKLATKVALNSRVGVEFSEYENGGSADPSLNGSIGLTYNASRLWSMNLALYRGAQADASSADVFTDVSSVRVGWVRKIRRASLNLGVSYEINAFQTSGTSTTTTREDRDYFSVDGSVGMPVFANSSFASVFLRFSDQSGSAADTWDAVQSGLSISRKF
jgi:hypothetical protein